LFNLKHSPMGLSLSPGRRERQAATDWLEEQIKIIEKEC